MDRQRLLLLASWLRRNRPLPPPLAYRRGLDLLMKSAPPGEAQLRKAAPGRLATSRPASVTRGWIVAAGFAAWASALWWVRSVRMNDAVQATVICMASLAAVNFAFDLLILKVHTSESNGLDWKKFNPSWHRTAIKFVGLLATLGFIGLLYWVFPEYHGDFYAQYKELLRRYLPWCLALSIPYIYLVDGLQKDQPDGYYAAGMAFTLQFDKVNAAVLWQHCLAWLVKGYFTALMFTYYVRYTQTFLTYDFSSIHDFRGFYDFCYFFIFLADSGLVCAGYLLTFRVFDTHIRRTEPTFRGWCVALVCYQPFWSWFSGSYLDYSKEYAWGTWLQSNPVLYSLWGSMILLLLAIYLWATITFGCRFSNLTHRGILTNGPYGWTKHPAYISKNTAYWLICIPFIVSQSPLDSIRRCVLLALLNYVYYLRAKTEEANLSIDPAYGQYAAWMKQHGIFRWLRRT